MSRLTEKLRDTSVVLLPIDCERPTVSVYEIVKPARQCAALLLDASNASDSGLSYAMLMVGCFGRHFVRVGKRSAAPSLTLILPNQEALPFLPNNKLHRSGERVVRRFEESEPAIAHFATAANRYLGLLPAARSGA